MTSPRHIVSLASAIALCPVLGLCVAEAQEPEHIRAESSMATARGADSPDDARTGSDPAQARELFLQAREQKKNGQLKASCETLQRSLSFNPTIGTLLNLGLCHRELDNVVTAHDYYRRAEVLATLSGDKERQEAAHYEAAQLAPYRATLWLRIPKAEPGELEVRIDDLPQPREVWSNPMFIDAGEHTVSIRAPERAPFQQRVHIENGVRQELVVPDLQLQPSAPLLAAEQAPHPSTMVSPEVLALHQSRQRQQAELGAMRIAAFGVGGAGIVSLGVGLLFGALAKNANADSEAHCNRTCTDQGVMLRETAFDHATRSTVLSIAGGVALASGVALWLLAPAPDIAPGPTLALSLSSRALGPELRGTY
jgi:tetratricopeptide (TPR) repeat protein